MAFKQWKHRVKTLDSSASTEEHFNSPESRVQREESENKSSTSRREDIYDGQAGFTQNHKGPRLKILILNHRKLIP